MNNRAKTCYVTITLSCNNDNIASVHAGDVHLKAKKVYMQYKPWNVHTLLLCTAKSARVYPPVVALTGLEPVTHGTSSRCSTLLNYSAIGN